MPYTNTGKNTMLDALGITHISAHTAAPGETGINEVTGGTYARQSLTFSAAAAGTKDSSNVPAIPIPAATTVTHLGYWDALTVGNFLGFTDIADETFTNAGTLTVSDVDIDLNL